MPNKSVTCHMTNEKRLIDANELLTSKWWDSMHDAFEKARAKIIIQSAKTVDAVHAAGACYCGECKHWKKCVSSLIGEVMCCTGQGSAYIQKGADDFCSRGERITDG